MWQGIGHGASIYSACALPPMVGYLDSGKTAAHRHLLPRLIGSAHPRRCTVRTWR